MTSQPWAARCMDLHIEEIDGAEVLFACEWWRDHPGENHQGRSDDGRYLCHWSSNFVSLMSGNEDVVHD